MSDGLQDTATLLPGLSGLLLSEQTVTGLLDIIVNLAVSAVPGVDGASVSIVMREGEKLETTNASSELITEVDQAQYRDRRGPCVEAIMTGKPVRTVLPDDRWLPFGDQAMSAGVHAVMSLPLRVRDRTTGALNLFSSSPEGLDPVEQASATLIAEQAAVVLANAAALTSAELANQHLQEALNTRDLIGQAKGIIMTRQGMTSDEAFDVLRRSSQRTGRKLRDIAGEVVGGLEHGADAN